MEQNVTTETRCDRCGATVRGSRPDRWTHLTDDTTSEDVCETCWRADPVLLAFIAILRLLPWLCRHHVAKKFGFGFCTTCETAIGWPSRSSEEHDA